MKSTSPRSIKLDDAAAEAGRRQRAGDRQPDRGVVRRVEHLVGEDVAGLRQAPGVERLKAAVDELPDVGAAARPVVFDRLFPTGSSLVCGPETPALGGAYAIEHSTGDLQKLCRSAEKP